MSTLVSPMESKTDPLLNSSGYHPSESSPLSKTSTLDFKIGAVADLSFKEAEVTRDHLLKETVEKIASLEIEEKAARQALTCMQRCGSRAVFLVGVAGSIGGSFALVVKKDSSGESYLDAFSALWVGIAGCIFSAVISCCVDVSNRQLREYRRIYRDLAGRQRLIEQLEIYKAKVHLEAAQDLYISCLSVGSTEEGFENFLLDTKHITAVKELALERKKKRQAEILEQLEKERTLQM